MVWDCTPYPHYYDLLMPFVLIAGVAFFPTLFAFLAWYLKHNDVPVLGNYDDEISDEAFGKLKAIFPDYPRTLIQVAASLPGEPLYTAPHCDGDVLHAPSECQYCDEFPDRQAQRVKDKVNFTGHHDPSKKPCPAEVRRDLDTINKWPGNRPSLAGDGEDD